MLLVCFLPKYIPSLFSADQWSPDNREGKKCYDREFLLQFQSATQALIKPAGLPDIPGIVLDKVNNIFSGASSVVVYYFRAPTANDIGGGILLCIRSSVCSSVHQAFLCMPYLKPCMLGFWIFIYGFPIKIADPYFFLVRHTCTSRVMPVWKYQN